MTNENESVALVAEQLRRFQDNLDSRLKLLEQRQDHNRDLTSEQLALLRQTIQELKSDVQDHETRIRSNTDAASGFRLLTGGASLTSIIALIKSFLS